MAKSTAKDEAGVEYILETGYGNVTSIEDPKPGGRNAKVFFSADGLKLPVYGWADSTDPEVWEPAQEALNTGRRVTFRIEVHRDPSVKGNLSIAEIDAKDRRRRLVLLKPATGVMAQPERTNGHAQHDEPPPADDSDPGPQEPGGAPRSPRMAEGKPWEHTNSDGSPNLGSYAFMASVSMVEYAYEKLCAYRATQAQEGRPSKAQVVALAKMLLDAADAAQINVRPDGHLDRMDSSHTRSRGAVRTVVEADGIPWDEIRESPDGRVDFVRTLSERATTLLDLALELDK